MPRAAKCAAAHRTDWIQVKWIQVKFFAAPSWNWPMSIVPKNNVVRGERTPAGPGLKSANGVGVWRTTCTIQPSVSHSLK